MKDLRVVTSRVMLDVQSVTPIRGFAPPSVMVLGTKLDRTSEVFYNGIQAPEFLVSSPSRLVVKIPSSQIGRPLNELKVFSSAFTSKAPTLLTLELQRPFKTVEGVERLIQSWMLIFFTTPGSDVWDPNSGGGVKAVIGRNTDASGKGVSADLALAIERTSAELKRLQAQNPRIPLSEKLLSAGLSGMNFDSETATLSATVSIKNMLGETAESTIR